MEHLPDNSILVRWDPLPEEQSNGQLSGYKVYLRVYKDHYQWHGDGELGQCINVSSSENHVVLSKLDGGRRYQVSVAAFTVEVGHRSDWETFLVGKCAFTYIPLLYRNISGPFFAVAENHFYIA